MGELHADAPVVAKHSQNVLCMHPAPAEPLCMVNLEGICATTQEFLRTQSVQGVPCGLQLEAIDPLQHADPSQQL